MTPEQIATARKECSEAWLGVHSARSGWRIALDEIDILREELKEAKDVANYHIMENTKAAFELVKLRAVAEATAVYEFALRQFELAVNTRTTYLLHDAKMDMVQALIEWRGET